MNLSTDSESSDNVSDKENEEVVETPLNSK
jgi:hypothetical protein